MKNIVKKLRKEKGLTQRQLSVLSKVGQSTISNIETEEYTPRVCVALRICRVLEVLVEDTFILED